MAGCDPRPPSDKNRISSLEQAMGPAANTSVDPTAGVGAYAVDRPYEPPIPPNAYAPAAHAHPLGATVRAERTHGLPSTPGTSSTASPSDHGHGTAGAFFPNDGVAPTFPMIDLRVSSYIQFRRTGTEFHMAFLQSRAGIGDEGLLVVGPVASNGFGRPTLEMYGQSGGTSYWRFFNDLDVNGAYGDTPATNRYSLVEVAVGDYKADAFLTGSAGATKGNVQPIVSGRMAVRRLRPVMFDRGGPNGSRRQGGLVAEEVEAVIPEAVVRLDPNRGRPVTEEEPDEDAPLAPGHPVGASDLAIDQGVIVATALRALQEAFDEIDALRGELGTLRADVAALKRGP